MVDGIAAVQARIGEPAPARRAADGRHDRFARPRDGFGGSSGVLHRRARGPGALEHGSPDRDDHRAPRASRSIAAAEKYTGTPYVWGGESLAEGGLDCSGLVQRSLADIGVTGIPRTAREQMTLGTAVPSLDQALPGDLWSSTAAATSPST